MYNSISLQPYLPEVTFQACFVNTHGNYRVRGLVYIIFYQIPFGRSVRQSIFPLLQNLEDFHFQQLEL